MRVMIWWRLQKKSYHRFRIAWGTRRVQNVTECMEWWKVWGGREEGLILRGDFTVRLGTWGEAVLELLVEPETYCTIPQVTVVCIFTIRFTYRGADKSLARPGRKQANVSDRMAWISFGALPCRGGKKNLMTARVDVVEIARVPDVLPSLFSSWSG